MLKTYHSFGWNTEVMVLRALRARPHVNCIAMQSVCVNPGGGATISLPRYSMDVLDYIQGSVGPFHATQDAVIRSVPICQHVVGQMGAALVHLHDLGFVHMDVSVCNYLLSRVDFRVVLIDFELAARAGDLCRHTEAGKDGYRAPEIGRAGCVLHPRVDAFSFGACVCAVFFGCLPAENTHLMNDDFALISRGRMCSVVARRANIPEPLPPCAVRVLEVVDDLWRPAAYRADISSSMTRLARVG